MSGPVAPDRTRPTRPYRLRKRAERQEETRRRIVAAALAVHGEVGPVRTTVSAVAARAGVERLTVYRHFPDEGDLLAACVAALFTASPLPDMAAWFGERHPPARLLRALRELYGWYRTTDPVAAALIRDAAGLPALRDGLRPLTDALEALPAALSEGWPTLGPDGRARLGAVIAHGLGVGTWQSLARDRGLADADAAALLVAAARTAAQGEA